MSFSDKSEEKYDSFPVENSIFPRKKPRCKPPPDVIG